MPRATTLSDRRDEEVAEPPDRSSQTRIAPAQVFVAEDDDEMRSAIKGILLADGYAVVEAADGDHALELLARAADERGALPDVVLLDFVMPGFSGLGVLRAMRRFEHPPPAIVMT